MDFPENPWKKKSENLNCKRCKQGPILKYIKPYENLDSH